MRVASSILPLPLLLAASLASAAPPPSPAAPDQAPSPSGQPAGLEPVNRIVLRVNGQIATLADYRDRRDIRLEAIAQSPGLSTEERRRLGADAGRAAMREIYDELLVLSRAEQLRIRPTTGQVQAAIENTRRRMGLEDPEQFEAALASSGLTLAGFRERMEKNLAFNEVLEREVQAKVKVEDDVVLRLYRDSQERWRTAERRRVEELVVRDDASLGAAERAALAAELAAAVAGGEAMAAAIERLGGGAVAGPIDLGWVVEGELAPELDAAVQALTPGTVSAPVAGRGGLHVLRVVELDPATLRPFDEVKDQIRAEEGQVRFEAATRKFLTDLERTAYVVESLPEEAVGYRTLAPADTEAEDALAAFAPVRERTAPAAAPPASAAPPAAAEGEPAPPAAPEPPPGEPR